MSYDPTPEDELFVRMVQACLAQYKVFSSITKTRNYNVEVILEDIRHLGRRISKAQTKLHRKLGRITSICEDLYTSRQLGSCRKLQECQYSEPTQFLAMCALNHLDQFVLDHVKDRTISNLSRSELLLCSVASKAYKGLYDMEQKSPLIEWLLENGADPQWRGVVPPHFSFEHIFLKIETPFVRFLEGTLCRLVGNRFLGPNRYLKSSNLVIQTIARFLQHGGMLTDFAYFSVYTDHPYTCVLLTLGQALALALPSRFPRKKTQRMVIRVPAFVALEAILSHLIPGPSDITAKRLKDSLLLRCKCINTTVKGRVIYIVDSENTTTLGPRVYAGIEEVCRVISNEDSATIIKNFQSLITRPFSFCNWQTFLEQCQKPISRGRILRYREYDLLFRIGVLREFPTSKIENEDERDAS